MTSHSKVVAVRRTQEWLEDRVKRGDRVIYPLQLSIDEPPEFGEQMYMWARYRDICFGIHSINVALISRDLEGWAGVGDSLDATYVIIDPGVRDENHLLDVMKDIEEINEYYNTRVLLETSHPIPDDFQFTPTKSGIVCVPAMATEETMDIAETFTDNENQVILVDMDHDGMYIKAAKDNDWLIWREDAGKSDAWRYKERYKQNLKHTKEVTGVVGSRTFSPSGSN